MLRAITHAEHLVQTHAGPMVSASVSVSIHKPYLDDLVGHALLVPSISFDSYNLSSPSSTKLPNLHQWSPLIQTLSAQYLAVWHSIFSHLQVEEAFLMLPRRVASNSFLQHLSIQSQKEMDTFNIPCFFFSRWKNHVKCTFKLPPFIKLYFV